MFKAYIQSYPAAYETLRDGKPFTCVTTGEVFDAVPPPVAVILDVRNLTLSWPGPRRHILNHYSFLHCINYEQREL
jgi:hypothetical protein